MTKTKVRKLITSLLSKYGDMILFRYVTKGGIPVKNFHVSDVLKEFDREEGQFYRILTSERKLAYKLADKKGLRTINIVVE